MQCAESPTAFRCVVFFSRVWCVLWTHGTRHTYTSLRAQGLCAPDRMSGTCCAPARYSYSKSHSTTPQGYCADEWIMMRGGRAVRVSPRWWWRILCINAVAATEELCEEVGTMCVLYVRRCCRRRRRHCTCSMSPADLQAIDNGATVRGDIMGCVCLPRTPHPIRINQRMCAVECLGVRLVWWLVVALMGRQRSNHNIFFLFIIINYRIKFENNRAQPLDAV